METELIVDVLYGPARTLGGSRLNDDELIRLASDEFEGRSFCVVRDWMILDVMLPEPNEQSIRNQGLQPSILYAHRTVFDSEARFSAGESVITSYQQSFEDCFFESKDTLYILAGRGSRKHASLPAVLALEAY